MLLRGVAARLFNRVLDIDDDGGPPPSSLALAVDDAAVETTSTVECQPIDDCGNYYTWPDDPDDVPGWVIQAEARRLAAGITDPLPARTHREFRQQLEMAAVIIASSDAVVKAAPSPALSPSDAARAFLDDLMAEAGELGERLELGVAALAERYEAHCERENRVPCAIEQMKGKLARLPGCTRTKADERRNGRRYRPVVWIIDPGHAEIVESVTQIVPFKMAA